MLLSAAFATVTVSVCVIYPVSPPHRTWRAEDEPPARAQRLHGPAHGAVAAGDGLSHLSRPPTHLLCASCSIPSGAPMSFDQTPSVSSDDEVD